MNEENVQRVPPRVPPKPTPPPLREFREGEIPKRRGRPPKVRPIEPVCGPGAMEPMPGVPGDLIEGTADRSGLKSLKITRLPEGVVRAADLPVHVPACDIPQPCTGGTLPTVSLSEDRIVKIHAPTPLLTLHLRRAGREITDTTGKVHIPASGAIPDGTKLVAHFYREE